MDRSMTLSELRAVKANAQLARSASSVETLNSNNNASNDGGSPGSGGGGGGGSGVALGSPGSPRTRSVDSLAKSLSGTALNNSIGGAKRQISSEMQAKPGGGGGYHRSTTLRQATIQELLTEKQSLQAQLRSLGNHVKELERDSNTLQRLVEEHRRGLQGVMADPPVEPEFDIPQAIIKGTASEAVCALWAGLEDDSKALFRVRRRTFENATTLEERLRTTKWKLSSLEGEHKDLRTTAKTLKKALAKAKLLIKRMKATQETQRAEIMEASRKEMNEELERRMAIVYQEASASGGLGAGLGVVGEEDDDFPRRDISGMIKLRRMRRMSVSQASDTSNGSLGDALAAARSPRRGGSGGGGGAGSSGDGTDIGGEESELRHMLRMGSTLSELEESVQVAGGEEGADRDVALRERYGIPRKRKVQTRTGVPFWEEGADSRVNIVYDDGRDGLARSIHAATLNKLIEYVTEGNLRDGLVRKEDFFVVSYRFAVPEVILDVLIQRYRCPKVRTGMQAFDDLIANKIITPVKLRVLSLLRYWMEAHWEEDWHGNDELATRLGAFVDRYVRADGFERTGESLLRTVVEKEAELLEKREARMRRRRRSIRHVLPPGESRQSLTATLLSSWTPEEVAEQLTFLDSEAYGLIDLIEFRWESWGEAASDPDNHGLAAFTAQFNAISGWVSSSVLDFENPSSRAKIIQRFVRVASSLADMNNFNTMMAILGAINSTPIKRLKRTWDEVRKQDTKALAALNELMSSKASFSNYRRVLDEVGDGTPCIPFVGLVLSDLTMTDLGNPDLVEGGLVNYTKAAKMAALVRNTLRFQQYPYGVREDQEVLNQLRALIAGDATTEEELYALSRRYEPPSARRPRGGGN